MKNNILYLKLHNLYYSLNNNLLQSLQDHVKAESGNKYTLESLIKDYSEKQTSHRKSIIKFATELNNSNSITDMETYYDFIDDMLFVVMEGA